MTQHIKSLLGNKTLLLLAILYSCAISVIFLMPMSGLAEVDFPGVDKLVHIAIHFFLIIFWQSYLYVKGGYKIEMKSIIVLLILILFYGIIIELFQYLFTISRQADVLDVLANLTGSFLGIIFFKKIKHIFQT